MKNLTWSDNICTVGWTSVHARMQPKDMEWLQEMQPRGHFTPTFSPPWSCECCPGAVRAFLGEFSERGYYFTFPEDKAGTALLVALKVRGMTGERWMSRRPAWKRWRQSNQ
jgi:hypothetical protein